MITGLGVTPGYSIMPNPDSNTYINPSSRLIRSNQPSPLQDLVAPGHHYDIRTGLVVQDSVAQPTTTSGVVRPQLHPCAVVGEVESICNDGVHQTKDIAHREPASRPYKM